MSDLFEPTFHTVIEPHPTTLADVVDVIDEVPLPPTRQFATHTQDVEATPPSKKTTRIKLDPDAVAVLPNCCSKLPCGTDNSIPPMCATSMNDGDKIVVAMGAAFAIGVISGVLISFAFSSQPVGEL